MKNSKNLKNESIKGFAWRLTQNVSTQLMGFIIQIVLARILLPTDYGIIALTSTFISILNVIVTTGFTSALIQQKHIDEVDKSSMFYASLLIGIVLYLVVFFSAPFLSWFYKEELLTDVFRVQGISVLIASIFSVHNAIIIRDLSFKKSFVAGLVAVICQGLIGIPLALNGFGVWALVFGTLTNTIVNCLLTIILCRWLPKLVFSFSSIKKLFSFSSKILAGNVLNTIYNSSKTLVIGRAYDTELLGYYNKGYQFPITMMTGVDGAMTTVLFSSLSKIQDDKKRLVLYLRKSMKLSLTIVVPMLCGMAAVADPMIRLLLTDKWAEAIPFVMLTCAICLTWPLSARTQALNAIGKSGTNLIINIIMKIIGIGLIFASIPFGVYVMCISSLFSFGISFTIYSVIISRNFDYPIKQQLTDVFPIYLVGFVMFGAVYLLSTILNVNLIIKLLVLVTIGVVIYVGLSLIFKMEGFLNVIDIIKGFFTKKKKAEIQQNNNENIVK